MKRRKFTSKFKTKVVLEALSERFTVSQLAERHQLHPNQISNWKSQFLANVESVFAKGKNSQKSEADQEKDSFLRTIGEQKVRIDFLKNALR